LTNFLGPWTYLNLNHLNTTRFTIRFDLQPNIRERNAVVKREPTVMILNFCSVVSSNDKALFGRDNFGLYVQEFFF
jgi:hypothetical protein